MDSVPKIYTKTGDLGETGLWGGGRVSKNHPRVQAYGDVDELNSALGLCAAAVHRLEREIDALTEDLPPLKQFILPGGCEAGARLHLARGVCRRAEREVV